jgi:glycosyltransferase involved in cell wall biosynthesis
MDIDFFIDRISPTMIDGWAWSPAEPELPISIEVVGEDETPMARTIADGFREDLFLAGKRGGWCAFRMDVDPDWPSGTYLVSARVGETSHLLGQSFYHEGPPANEDVVDVGEPTVAPSPPLSGHCDGIRNGYIAGWACRRDLPDAVISIEVSIDGVVFASVDADEYRPDLRIAGIGHGRHGWRIPFPRVPPGQTVQVVARERGGAPLSGGEFAYPDRPTAEELANPEILAFVDAAFAVGRLPGFNQLPRPLATTNFLVYAPGSVHSSEPGVAEHNFALAFAAFLPLVEAMGRVHRVADPFTWQTDALIDEAMARGEACLLLSFAPLHRTPLGLRCSVVPMIGCEYPNIPDREWDREVRHNWHYVLRQTGRCITHSRWSAAAIRAALGADFPVAFVPLPVWDRISPAQPIAEPSGTSELTVEGLVLDTRVHHFGAYDDLPSPHAADLSGRASVRISGTVFTTVVAGNDEPGNWLDILAAFFAVHRSTPDATLVIRMTGVDPDLWWWGFHEAIVHQGPIECRVVLIHGDIDFAQYRRLIAASHWIVNASRAEGHAQPLLEFMSAGRPAIAPVHSAMTDYIDASNALIVAANEEYCSWPRDPSLQLVTTHHRVNWDSLRDAFAAAYRETTSDPAGYSARAAAARDTMQRYCSDAVVAQHLDGFLGLGLELADLPMPPSALLRDTQPA